MRREDVGAFIETHLDPGESLLACFEAKVAEVNGRSGAAADTERVLLALTGSRLVTLAWRGSAEPELDASIPLWCVVAVQLEPGDACPGGAAGERARPGLVVRLSGGEWARFLAPDDDLHGAAAAEGLARAFSTVGTSPRPHRHGDAEPPGGGGGSAGALTAADAGTLARRLAALAERGRRPVPELAPVVTVERDAGANSYFVHVHPDRVPEGACPRCRHEIRPGAVFCDACGALQ